MNIGIQTWGSNGDIRPLLALADGLQRAGHRVTLVASSIDNRNYRAECESRQIGYRQVPEHIRFDMEGFAARTFRMHPLHWLRALLDEAFFPWEEEIFQASQTLTTENDLVIGHHFLYPLKLAARQQGKPFYSITLCPVAIPAPSEAPFRFPNLGRHLNPLSWKLLDTLVNGILKTRMTRLWQASGQKPPASVLNDLLTSQTLNLIAVDPVFCPGHHTWAGFHQVCGFLNLEEDDAGAWPTGLREFIESGPPPVYMTFGSLQQAVPDWSMELFLEAAELAKVRAIIQTSSPHYPAGSPQDRIFLTGRHSHQPVFRQCAAVIHHGGAGTTQAASRSGCPSVVVPFMDEQVYWGRQLQKLGMAGKPLPAARVTARTLAAGIREVCSRPDYRHQAGRISQRMQADPGGVSRAVRLIEAVMAGCKLRTQP